MWLRLRPGLRTQVFAPRRVLLVRPAFRASTRVGQDRQRADLGASTILHLASESVLGGSVWSLRGDPGSSVPGHLQERNRRTNGNLGKAAQGQLRVREPAQVRVHANARVRGACGYAATATCRRAPMVIFLALGLEVGRIGSSTR